MEHLFGVPSWHVLIPVITCFCFVVCSSLFAAQSQYVAKLSTGPTFICKNDFKMCSADIKLQKSFCNIQTFSVAVVSRTVTQANTENIKSLAKELVASQIRFLAGQFPMDIMSFIDVLRGEGLDISIAAWSPYNYDHWQESKQKHKEWGLWATNSYIFVLGPVDDLVIEQQPRGSPDTHGHGDKGHREVDTHGHGDNGPEGETWEQVLRRLAPPKPMALTKWVGKETQTRGWAILPNVYQRPCQHTSKHTVKLQMFVGRSGKSQRSMEKVIARRQKQKARQQEIDRKKSALPHSGRAPQHRPVAHSHS